MPRPWGGSPWYVEGQTEDTYGYSEVNEMGSVDAPCSPKKIHTCSFER
jgi:hypothetical protein